MTHRYEHSSQLDHPAREVYAWHTRPGAFERLVPPWQRVDLVDPGPGVVEGGRSTLNVYRGGLSIRWTALHDEVVPERSFRDVQVRGPFAMWRHRHRFEPEGRGSRLRDTVDYRLPLDRWSHPIFGGALRRDLDRLFAARHATTRADLDLHARIGGPPRRIVLVTPDRNRSARRFADVVAALASTGGHEVLRDGCSSERSSSATRDVDATIIVGGPAFDGRVTVRSAHVDSKGRQPDRRGSSRSGATVLVSSLENAAIVGRGRVAPRVVEAWERAAMPASTAGRTVCLRLGTVLDPMSGWFRRRRYRRTFPDGWVVRDDAAAATLTAALDEGWSGTVDVAIERGPVVTEARAATALGFAYRYPTREAAWTALTGRGEIG